MMGSVRQEGSVAVKSYLDGARTGVEAARRAELLSRAGVTTPLATYNPDTSKLCSPWIDGLTGRGLFLSLPLFESAGDIAGHSDLLTRAIQPICELHALAPGALGLPLLDPFEKIDNRLQQTGQIGALLSLNIDTQAKVCRALLAKKWRPSPAGVVLHGDFHLGQVVFDQRTLKIWLLDLDDMATGPAEFDLANFAAHFVTSRQLYTGSIEPGFATAIQIMARAYQTATGTRLDQRLLYLSGATSLLRRGLKLAERHESKKMVMACIESSHALAINA